MPPRLLFLDETRSDESEDHVVELSDAHTSLGNPVLSGLDWQPGGLRPFDLLPEGESFAREEVALPENPPEQVRCFPGNVSRFEKYSCLGFRRVTCGSSWHC